MVKASINLQPKPNYPSKLNPIGPDSSRFFSSKKNGTMGNSGTAETEELPDLLC